MEYSELEAKYKRLVDLSSRMRGWQKERDKRRFLTDPDHKRMKHLEREVDKIITEELKNQKSNQKELF